jgi:hypothetical protein
MINFIEKIKSMIFKKVDEGTGPKSESENYFEVFLALDKNFNINVLIYLNDTKIETMTENDTALIYYEFLNSSFTKNIQNTISQILEKDIKDNSNKNLINEINTLIEYKQYLTDDLTYIKPTQVFAKYINDAQ